MGGDSEVGCMSIILGAEYGKCVLFKAEFTCPLRVCVCSLMHCNAFSQREQIVRQQLLTTQFL